MTSVRECETCRSFEHDRDGHPGRRLEGQAVTNVFVDTPQLASPLQRGGEMGAQ